METIDIDGEHEIQVKRFYLPVEVEITCPDCQAKLSKDFEQDYLSYPVTNKKESVYLYCDDCDGEFEFDVVLKLSLDIDGKARKLS